MCQWNSDFPSCPATIIELKATLSWMVAEGLMQEAVQQKKTNGYLTDRWSSSANALGWGKLGLVAC